MEFPTFGDLAGQLRGLTEQVPPALRALTDEDWDGASAPGKWTRREILGHLIDSAVNNHQRIVRAVSEGGVTWPGYDQVAQVRAGRYGAAPQVLLIDTWTSLNTLLAHVIRGIPGERRGARCAIGGAPAMPLSALVEDYIAHMEHHLRQIAGSPESVRYSGMPWPPLDPNRQWPT